MVRLLMLSPLLTAPAFGQQAASQPDDRRRGHSTTRPATEPLPAPRYAPLRYNDDFSYLQGPAGSYRADFFDPIKNINLDDNWHLSLGGELRERMESETNKNFGSRDPTHDAFLLQRYVLFGDLKYRKSSRVFFEGIDAQVNNRDLPEQPGMENRFDINQAFFDLRVLGEDCPLTLRAGRQQLSYGRERVIGKSDWTNAPRRFDGFKLFYPSEMLDVDVFYMRPIVFQTKPFNTTLKPPIDEGLNRKPDHYREEAHFYGLYSTYKGIRNHALDFYVLGLNDNDRLVNPNGRIGDESIYTIGSRIAGTSGCIDYDVEGAGQWGKWAGDDQKAWLFGGEAGYTAKKTDMTPRLGIGLDYGSGDDTPRDRTAETLNQLFPTGHSQLGFIDIVGRQNILAPNLNFSLTPVKNVVTRLTWYHFWLSSNLDALYNKSGNPSRRNVSGSSGNDVGDELDVTVSWQIDVHSNLLVGWSHLWPGNFIESSGRSLDADMVYVQYLFKF